MSNSECSALAIAAVAVLSANACRPANMPEMRRPSILNTPRYGMEDNHQMQKAIQTLRFKTQESMSQSREEIARLEEENEIKQMRIEEVDAELEALEAEGAFGQMASLKDTEESQHETSRRARRRWSLAALGAGFRNHQEDEADLPMHRRSKSLDEDGELEVDDEEAEEPPGDRPKRFTLMARNPTDRLSFRKARSESGNKISEVQKETLLMERLHDIQQENKRLIEQQETNLTFKEEQVKALQLAYEAQGNITEALQEEIDQSREEAKFSGDSSPQADTVGLKERLLALDDKENEISSQIRLIKRIKKMDDDERKSAISVLKKDIVESAIRLKSVKRMFEANQEMLQEDVSKSEAEWALLGARIALMERVSQKQVRQLEKKAAKAESDELTDLIERATRALEEELVMRHGPSEVSQTVLQQETVYLEELVTALLDCCDSFAEGLLLLKSKKISLHIGASISDTIRQMEKRIEATENTISSALFVVEEATDAYAQDDTLLPDDVQAAYLASDGTANSANEDSPSASSHEDTRTEEDVEFDDLQDRNDDLDAQLREAKHKLEGTRKRAECELDELKSKIDELKVMYEDGGVDWGRKDEEMERALREAAEAKIGEDRLRDFLERTARSRVSDDQ
jgi:hypothetical protein